MASATRQGHGAQQRNHRLARNDAEGGDGAGVAGGRGKLEGGSLPQSLPNHSFAARLSCWTPRPLSYSSPMLNWASAKPWPQPDSRLEPAAGFRVVLLTAKAFAVRRAQRALRLGEALRGDLIKPGARLGEVLRTALALGMHCGQVELRPRIALRGGLPVPAAGTFPMQACMPKGFGLA